MPCDNSIKNRMVRAELTCFFVTFVIILSIITILFHHDGTFRSSPSRMTLAFPKAVHVGFTLTVTTATVGTEQVICFSINSSILTWFKKNYKQVRAIFREILLGVIWGGGRFDLRDRLKNSHNFVFPLLSCHVIISDNDYFYIVSR